MQKRNIFNGRVALCLYRRREPVVLFWCLFGLCLFPNFNYLRTDCVKIIGIYEKLEEAKIVQKNDCGCLSKINKCWKGNNGIITWILEANIGTLKNAIDIRETHNVL